MNKKRILLARPNSFIVKSMKKLIEDAGYIPTPLESLDQIAGYSASEIGGFVISTGVSSVVKASYSETIINAIATHPDRPILLASLIDPELVKSTVFRKFKDQSLERKMLSISEGSELNRLSAQDHILILEKKDIVDEEKFPNTLATVRKFFV